MKTINFYAEDAKKFVNIINASDYEQLNRSSSSVLIQVFSALTNEEELVSLCSFLKNVFPAAEIIGTTTSGEICYGDIHHNTICLSVSFFEDTVLRSYMYEYRNEEFRMGSEMASQIKKECTDTDGIMLMASIQNIDGSSFIEGFRSVINDTIIFGAGAGSYGNINNSFIFLNGTVLRYGTAAIVFCGGNLEINVHTYAGWQPLSREMTITGTVDAVTASEIDGAPAVNVYQKYLRIKNDENFFMNSIEFPLYIHRKNQIVARIPVGCTENGELIFVADVKKGDTVRLACGNPESIIRQSEHIRKKIAEACPQSVFLYSCNIRQIFLGENVISEVKPLADITSVSGFFTYGEITGDSDGLNLLNATMLAITMKENKKGTQSQPGGLICTDNSIEWNLEGQISVVSRLSFFINEVLEELHDSYIKMQIMAETDPLTCAYNRRKTLEYLDRAIEISDETHVPALIMADIDFFKHINDTYGHDAGDEVLKKFTEILRNNSADDGHVGRWGGEEFLIVFPESGEIQLEEICEKMRSEIENYRFFKDRTVTASFGLVRFRKDYNREKFCKVVDDCLYKAKTSGRNRVCTPEDLT